jgi:hypothetical protein
MTDPRTDFKKYLYSFEVISIQYERASFEVKFIPNDPTLMSITYGLPFDADFDITQLASYVERFAPHDKWFAQEMILNHGNALLKAKS